MTTKPVDPESPEAKREVGEKLYASVKGAYTAGGSLIAVVEGVSVELGRFENGTFVITAEGKKVAIAEGILPEEPEPPSNEAPAQPWVPHPDNALPPAGEEGGETPDQGDERPNQDLPEGGLPPTAATLPGIITKPAPEPPAPDQELPEGEEAPDQGLPDTSPEAPPDVNQDLPEPPPLAEQLPAEPPAPEHPVEPPQGPVDPDNPPAPLEPEQPIAEPPAAEHPVAPPPEPEQTGKGKKGKTAGRDLRLDLSDEAGTKEQFST